MMDESPDMDGCGQLDLSHTLLKLVTSVLANVKIKGFLISRDHMINKSCDLVD